MEEERLLSCLGLSTTPAVGTGMMCRLKVGREAGLFKVLKLSLEKATP